MPAPLIAVTTGWRLNEPYRDALENAGAAVLEFAPGTEQSLDGVRGLMLTGGADIDPARYGEPRHETVEKVSPERDEMESRLIEWADERSLPVLAICRGMQMLNVARGGSLHQHIPDSFPDSTCDHRKKSDPKWETAHNVRIEPGTALASIVGTGVIPVNSRHHQAVNRLGEGLVVTGCAPDGVIESVELPEERFVVGVQWHPEDMAGHFASADALFAAFVAACH